MPSAVFGVGEHRAAVLAAQRNVDVAAVSFALIEFRHEGQALAVLIGDLLGAVLVDGVVVAGDPRVVVAERDLLLPEVALALDALAVHARAVHAQPDIAQQRLHPGRRVHRVVDVVVGGRRQPAVAGRPRLAKAGVEHHELQLGTDVGHQALLGEPVDLVVQDAARRRGDRAAVGPGQVGHHQRGARQPRDEPQRGEVGRHHHVAVTGLPARHRVPVDGVHVDIDGQQVVAAFGTVGGDILDEQPRRHPLAGQPALHIAERDDHGVDVTVGHQPFEVGLRQHAGSGAHCGPSSHNDGGHDEKPTIGDDVASAFTQMINQTVTSKGRTPDL